MRVGNLDRLRDDLLLAGPRADGFGLGRIADLLPAFPGPDRVRQTAPWSARSVVLTLVCTTTSPLAMRGATCTVSITGLSQKSSDTLS